MRLSRFVWSLTGFSLAVFTSHVLLTQELSASIRTGEAAAGALGGAAAVAAGCSETVPQSRKLNIEPYTATQKTTTVQTLANGTTITRETTAKEARDSSGKSFRETALDFPMGDGQTGKQSMFYVFDPVNRININWSSQTKVATVYHMPEPNQVRQTLPQPLSASGRVTFTSQSPTTQRQLQPKAQVEHLGTKTISGLEANGTRTTQTFAVGAIGNDQPFVVTHETWMSTELGIPVLQIHDDPRNGVQTMELIDIERGEPDPALFQPPEGYTVKDQYPNQQN
jgi:hypothetical protein